MSETKGKAGLDLSAGLMSTVDLSLSHIRPEDTVIDTIGEGFLPRMIDHEYGLIVFVSSDPDDLPLALADMHEAGFSEAFITIYEAAAAMGVMLIHFDRDGAVINGLPTFDW